MMGNGWCRGWCGSYCLLNARKKDSSNLDECRAACDNEEGCTGFAISDGSYSYPNRCYIYGIFSSTNQGVASSWIAMPHSYVVVFSTYGNHGVKCWEREKEIAKLACNFQFGFFDQL